MGFLPRDLARIACGDWGISLFALRTNKVTLGCFAATLKDSGTVYQRIADGVNERYKENGKMILEQPWITGKEIEELLH